MAEQKEKTWVEMVPLLVMGVHFAETPEEQARCMAELMKLANIVDHHIANLRTLEQEAKQKGNIICPDCGVKGGHAFGCPLAPTPECGNDDFAAAVHPRLR